MTVKSLLEIHGVRIYIKEMFRRFQIEIVKSHTFSMKIPELTTSETKSYAVYKVQINEERRRYFTVVNHLQTGHITRICQKFEHFGMLCRHILRYMFSKSVE